MVTKPDPANLASHGGLTPDDTDTAFPEDSQQKKLLPPHFAELVQQATAAGWLVETTPRRHAAEERARLVARREQYVLLASAGPSTRPDNPPKWHSKNLRYYGWEGGAELWREPTSRQALTRLRHQDTYGRQLAPASSAWEVATAITAAGCAPRIVERQVGSIDFEGDPLAMG
jgi:hypothetical protein